MNKLKLTRLISRSLMVISLLALSPIGASAEWKQDNQGWWYADGSSWYTGWKQIGANWYYFHSDGYMAHDTIVDRCYLNSSGAWSQYSNGNSAQTSDSNGDSAQTSISAETGNSSYYYATLVNQYTNIVQNDANEISAAQARVNEAAKGSAPTFGLSSSKSGTSGGILVAQQKVYDLINKKSKDEDMLFKYQRLEKQAESQGR